MTEQQIALPQARGSSWVTEWRGGAMSMLAVGIGGIIGAVARWQISEWSVDRWPSSFPWGTFLINVSGSFILGLYLASVAERSAGRSVTRLFVATGVLGAYTTFSTFVYETARLVQHGESTTAIAYVAASLVVGVAASVSGIAVGRAVN
jgi:fluoride exporter